MFELSSANFISNFPMVVIVGLLVLIVVVIVTDAKRGNVFTGVMTVMVTLLVIAMVVVGIDASQRHRDLRAIEAEYGLSFNARANGVIPRTDGVIYVPDVFLVEDQAIRDVVVRREGNTVTLYTKLDDTDTELMLLTPAE